MNYVRKLTKKWIEWQECLIIGYWGDKEIDLMKCLDIYAEAIDEKESTEDAMYSAFPEDADDIQVVYTVNPEFSYSYMRKQFDGCKKVLAFFKGDCVE